MIHGSFLPGQNIPACSLFVSWGNAMVSPFFVVDTGFTGELKIDPLRAEELGLAPTGVARYTNASNQIVHVVLLLRMSPWRGNEIV